MDRQHEARKNEVETIVLDDEQEMPGAGAVPATPTLEELLLRAHLPEIEIIHRSQMASGPKDAWFVRWRREDYPKMYATGSGATIRDAVLDALDALPDYEVVRADMRKDRQGTSGR
jgi:hypothetical protein